MPTYVLWLIGIIGALVVLVAIVIVCLVHYAREGAHNAGKLEVHESLLTEAKDEAQKERIRNL
jgi:hypothetical protein